MKIVASHIIDVTESVMCVAQKGGKLKNQTTKSTTKMGNKMITKQDKTLIQIDGDNREWILGIKEYLMSLKSVARRGVPRGKRVSCNDALTHIRGEMKKYKGIEEKLLDTHEVYEKKLDIIKNHFKTIKLNGQIIKTDFDSIPGLNDFFIDDEMKINGKKIKLPEGVLK